MASSSMAAIRDSIRVWWVNVYPERQRAPLTDGIWHAAGRSAEQGRDGRARFGEPRALYAVHVTPHAPTVCGAPGFSAGGRSLADIQRGVQG